MKSIWSRKQGVGTLRERIQRKVCLLSDGDRKKTEPMLRIWRKMRMSFKINSPENRSTSTSKWRKRWTLVKTMFSVGAITKKCSSNTKLFQELFPTSSTKFPMPLLQTALLWKNSLRKKSLKNPILFRNFQYPFLRKRLLNKIKSMSHLFVRMIALRNMNRTFSYASKSPSKTPSIDSKCWLGTKSDLISPLHLF